MHAAPDLILENVKIVAYTVSLVDQKKNNSKSPKF